MAQPTGNSIELATKHLTGPVSPGTTYPSRSGLVLRQHLHGIAVIGDYNCRVEKRKMGADVGSWI